MAVAMSQQGRVIDVSHSTAKKLGFFHRGLTRVKVEKVPEGTEE
jgi:rare lipoprotein A (peptidoglycan hydrolase)